MTGSTLSAPPSLRHAEMASPLGVRPARRESVELAERPFEESLREAQRATSKRDLAEPERLESPSREPAEAEQSGREEDQEDSAANEEPQELPSDRAETAHEAQEEPPSASHNEHGDAVEPQRAGGAEQGGTRSDATSGGMRGGSEPSAVTRDGSAQVAGRDDASAQVQTPQQAEAKIDAPVHVVDAPPTVHRINELLLTLDPRALHAAGLQQAPQSTEHAAGSTGEQHREHAATPFVPFGDALRTGSHGVAMHAAGERGDTADTAAFSGNSGVVAPADRGAVTVQSGQDTAVTTRESAADAKVVAAAAVAADGRVADSQPRGEAALQTLSRLAVRTVSPVDNAFGSMNGGGGAGAGGGQARDAAAGEVRSASGSQEPASPARQQQAFEAQLSRGLAAAVAQRGGRITLRLTPQALGDVRIDMTVREGVVSAQFEASTGEARELLGRSLEHLREVLHAKGLHVDRLEVREQTVEAVQTEHEARPEADARNHGREREDAEQRTDQERKAPGRYEDAAESAFEQVDGSPLDDGASVWRFGVDAIA